jgi:hypothetical protein
MPVEMHVDTSELDRYLGLLSTEGLAIVGEEFKDTLNDVLEYLQMLVVDRTPVNTGILRGSIYTEVRGAMIDNRGVNMTGVVSSSDYEPKVLAMERGRRAGRYPPIEAIALWVKRKGIEKDDAAIKRAAFAIARAIAQGRSKHQLKGGDKMFEQAATNGEAYGEKAFDQMLDRILERWAGL